MTRLPRTRALVLPLLLLVAALATAQAPDASGQLRLDVPPEPGGDLSFNVTSGAQPGRVHVLVTHEDPLAGTVVDRVVPLDLDAHTTARVVLQDVRRGERYALRVVDASLPIPTLSDASLLPDGARVLDLPALVEGLAPLPLLPGQTHAFRGYRVLEDDRAGSPARVFALPSGLVAVAMSQAVDAPGSARLQVAVSRDGGHTFAPPVDVSEGPISNGVNGWSGAAAADGALVFFYGETRPEDGTGTTRLARFDPRLGSVTRRGVVDEGSSYVMTQAVPLPGGDVLFLGSGLTRAEAPRWHPAIEAWRVSPLGKPTYEGNLSAGSQPAWLRAAAGPVGAVAVA